MATMNWISDDSAWNGAVYSSNGGPIALPDVSIPNVPIPNVAFSGAGAAHTLSRPTTASLATPLHIDSGTLDIDTTSARLGIFRQGGGIGDSSVHVDMTNTGNIWVTGGSMAFLGGLN